MARAQTGAYQNIAGGQFNNFAAMRAHSGTNGVAVVVLTRDTMINGKGDGFGGNFWWCEGCKQADDNNFFIPVNGTDSGRWVRVLSSLNTTLPKGTYNRLVLDSNGRLIAAYYDSVAIKAATMAQAESLRLNAAYVQIARKADKDSFNSYADKWAVSALNGYLTQNAGDARYMRLSGMGAYPTSARVDSLLQNFATFAGATFYPLSNPAKYISKDSVAANYQAKGNYIQTLTLNGNALSLSGGNTVTLPQTDTANLSARIDAKQATLGFTPYNSSNPAGYISSVPTNYMRYVDTASLSNRINGKQPAGTYLTSVPSTYMQYQDTASLSNRINQKQANLGFTPYNASNPSGYISTVPATYMKYVDTASLSARIDTKQPAGAYLTAVPSTYMRYTDTASISARIDGKQPIGSYLTAVPANYMKYADTASLSNRIDGKQVAGSYATTSQLAAKMNYTDTAAMLAPYTRTANVPAYSAGAGIAISSNVISTTASIVYLSNVTIAESAVVAIAAGVRKVTITGVTGIVAGDRVMLSPIAATPAGYAIADVVATATGTLQVTLTVPLIALGGSYSIVCKVAVFR